MEEAVYNTSVYFKNTSPVLGKIPPTSLSGGVKTLILMKFEPDKILNASTCGDNCAKWILKIAEKQELTIHLPESFGWVYLQPSMMKKILCVMEKIKLQTE